MKHFVRFFLALTFLFVMDISSAQEAAKSPKPGFLVFSKNKVSGENIARANALTDSLFGPVLDELVKDGKLLGWGQLMHAWGDEWNYNIYYTTESHQTFLDFWTEYINRLNKRFPGWASKTLGLIAEHKDNMYTIRRRTVQ
jgi:hypothetical protein